MNNDISTKNLTETEASEGKYLFSFNRKLLNADETDLEGGGGDKAMNVAEEDKLCRASRLLKTFCFKSWEK